MRTTNEIGNRRAYPKALKLAALKASKKAKKATKRVTVGAVAASFNISPITLNTWKRQAGIAAAQPSGLAAHQKAQAAIKAYNTPTVKTVESAKGLVTSIMYRGKSYR